MMNYSIPNVRFGSHKAKSGQKITNMTTTTIENINSQPSLTKSQSEHLKIVQTIYRTAPSGGVNNPTVRVSTIMIPKCTRLTLTCSAIGVRIEVNIRINTVESIAVPAMSKNTIMISITIQGTLEIPSMNSAIFCGICSQTIP